MMIFELQNKRHIFSGSDHTIEEKKNFMKYLYILYNQFFLILHFKRYTYLDMNISFKTKLLVENNMKLFLITLKLLGASFQNLAKKIYHFFKMTFQYTPNKSFKIRKRSMTKSCHFYDNLLSC